MSSLAGWSEGAGQGPAQQGHPVPFTQASLVGRRHSDRKESTSVPALVMSLCWRGRAGPAGPAEPPQSTQRNSQTPRGFRFVLVFTRLLWFLEACKLWGNSREPHTLRGGVCWPCGKSHPNSQSLSWEQMAKVMCWAPPWAPLGGAWLGFRREEAPAQPRRARCVSPSWRDVGKEMPTACLQMPEPPPPLMTLDTPGV